MKRILKVFAFVFALVLVLAACGRTETPPAETTPADDGVVIKVGASPAPHAVILEQLVPVLAEQGITLEIVQFDDYVMPNIALDGGDLDANYFQHKPYLDDFNVKNGTKLVAFAPIHYEPLGLYAGKTASVADLPDGAQIGIPADNTNGARALQLLVAEGLIELREGVGLEATELDIVKNPKNIKIVPMEAANLPASLPDLDLAVINGNYALGAGLDQSLLLVTEAADSDAAKIFSNVLAIREGDEGRPELKALADALRSDTVRTFLEETYHGVVLPSF